jgi:tetratricopeptide (TPR) repeat protein
VLRPTHGIRRAGCAECRQMSSIASDDARPWTVASLVMANWPRYGHPACLSGRQRAGKVDNSMVLAFRDRWGSPVCAERAGAVGLFDQAVQGLVSLSGDPVARADETIALDPALLLGRVLRGYLALYSTAASGFAQAQSLVGDLDPGSVGIGEREHLHVLAVQSWAGGEWERAAHFLKEALLHDPRDLLALKVAQDLAFFLGNRRDLRDIVARVENAWPAGSPGHGYVQGMLSFGLEENGQYEAAQERARRALDADRRDVWAVHAQAHIYEMKGAQRRGVAFLVESSDDWSSSYFAVHNWWHRALYHLELTEFDEAIGLYDGPIRRPGSPEWLDVVDAAALLWRLALFGFDVTDRARALPEDIEEMIAEPVYAFNDWHAVMAAGLARNWGFCEQLVLINRGVREGTNRRALESAGLDLLEGFAAFARGHADEAFHRLIGIRQRAHVVGGSNAQRDVIDLTLLAAAARTGKSVEADQLLAERVERKPTTREAGLELIRVNSR